MYQNNGVRRAFCSYITYIRWKKSLKCYQAASVLFVRFCVFFLVFVPFCVCSFFMFVPFFCLLEYKRWKMRPVECASLNDQRRSTETTVYHCYWIFKSNVNVQKILSNDKILFQVCPYAIIQIEYEDIERNSSIIWFWKHFVFWVI